MHDAIPSRILNGWLRLEEDLFHLQVLSHLPPQIPIYWAKPSIPHSSMKEHPDIVKFFHFSAYVRTRSAGILRGLPLSTRTLEQSLVCYTLSEVYRLPVRTYTAIAPMRHIG